VASKASIQKEKAEMEGAAVASQQELNENPYVAVLSRKIRNLKKK
jgi:nucleoside phosphorylase